MTVVVYNGVNVAIVLNMVLGTTVVVVDVSAVVVGVISAIVVNDDSVVVVAI